MLREIFSSNALTMSPVQVNAFSVRNTLSSKTGRRCLFLDRDGVVNSSPGTGYVTRSNEFSLNAGIGELLRTAHTAGWLSIIVSSQRCVAKGLLDVKALGSIHRSMQIDLMDQYGSNFDAIYVYTGEPGTEYWEKPKPGMIEQACRDYDINPSSSLLVGDQDRDIEMAKNAGIGQTVRVLIETENRSNMVAADQTVYSIPEMVAAVQQLLRGSADDGD